MSTLIYCREWPPQYPRHDTKVKFKKIYCTILSVLACSQKNNRKYIAFFVNSSFDSENDLSRKLNV